jgi:hypothetical protein
MDHKIIFRSGGATNHSQSSQKRRRSSNFNLRIFEYGRSIANAKQETFIASDWCPEKGKRPTVHISV